MDPRSEQSNPTADLLGMIPDGPTVHDEHLMEDTGLSDLPLSSLSQQPVSPGHERAGSLADAAMSSHSNAQGPLGALPTLHNPIASMASVSLQDDGGSSFAVHHNLHETAGSYSEVGRLLGNNHATGSHHDRHPGQQHATSSAAENMMSPAATMVDEMMVHGDKSGTLLKVMAHDTTSTLLPAS